MDVELYGLRIFYRVMMDKTFSRAAKSLRLTQPTISQQISKLETALQGKLFERVGHEVIPTQLGQELYTFTSSLLETVDQFGEKIQNQRSIPKGPVHYAMPESCQWTPHYRRIMSQIKSLPEITFKIDILTNDQIIRGL